MELITPESSFLPRSLGPNRLPKQSKQRENQRLVQGKKK